MQAARLLVFFATPHEGGNGTSIGDIVAKIARAALRTPSNDLLDALKRSSSDATRRFEQARHLPEKCLVISFYEGESYGQMGIVRSSKMIKE